MNELFGVLAFVSTIVLVLGLLSEWLDRAWLSAPLLALIAGVAVGPYGFDLIEPALWGDSMMIAREGARVVLAIGLINVAMSLPDNFVRQHARSLVMIVGGGMLLMTLMTAVLSWFVLGTSLLTAALIGAALASTDPVVAASITTGNIAQEKLPARVRHLVMAESGINDGVAMPLVMLPLLLVLHSVEYAWREWGVTVVLWEIGAGVVLGAVLGLGLGHALLFAQKHDFVDKQSLLAESVALALFTLGLGEVLGINSVLAVFVAGLFYKGCLTGSEQETVGDVDEAMERLFLYPFLGIVGLLLPLDDWVQLGWRGVLLAVAVLALRRLPVWLLLGRFVPSLENRREVLFTGWFGPLGVAAVFYLTMAAEQTSQEIIWIAGSLVMTASIVAHGISASPLTLLFGRAAQREEAARGKEAVRATAGKFEPKTAGSSERGKPRPPAAPAPTHSPG